VQEAEGLELTRAPQGAGVNQMQTGRVDQGGKLLLGRIIVARHEYVERVPDPGRPLKPVREGGIESLDDARAARDGAAQSLRRLNCPVE
jgi:hypothetical protein